jgi:hypothetical protein
MYDSETFAYLCENVRSVFAHELAAGPGQNGQAVETGRLVQHEHVPRGHSFGEVVFQPVLGRKAQSQKSRKSGSLRSGSRQLQPDQPGREIFLIFCEVLATIFVRFCNFLIKSLHRLI